MNTEIEFLNADGLDESVSNAIGFLPKKQKNDIYGYYTNTGSCKDGYHAGGWSSTKGYGLWCEKNKAE